MSAPRNLHRKLCFQDNQVLVSITCTKTNGAWLWEAAIPTADKLLVFQPDKARQRGHEKVRWSHGKCSCALGVGARRCQPASSSCMLQEGALQHSPNAPTLFSVPKEEWSKILLPLTRLSAHILFVLFCAGLYRFEKERTGWALWLTRARPRCAGVRVKKKPQRGPYWWVDGVCRNWLSGPPQNLEPDVDQGSGSGLLMLVSCWS